MNIKEPSFSYDLIEGIHKLDFSLQTVDEYLKHTYPWLTEKERCVLRELFADFEPGEKDAKRKHARRLIAYRYFLSSANHAFKKYETNKIAKNETVFHLNMNNILGDGLQKLVTAVKNCIIYSVLLQEGSFWRLYVRGIFNALQEEQLRFVLAIIGKLSGCERKEEIVAKMQELDGKTVAYIKSFGGLSKISTELAQKAFQVLRELNIICAHFEGCTENPDENVDQVVSQFAFTLNNDRGLIEVLSELLDSWQKENAVLWERRSKGLQLYINARNGEYDTIDKLERSVDKTLFDQGLKSIHINPVKKQLLDAVQYYLARSQRDGESFWLLFAKGEFDNVPVADLNFILSIIGRESSSGDDLWTELEERVYTYIQK